MEICMQQSALVFFCEKCGAANTTQATTCFACKESLNTSSLTPNVESFIVTPVNATSVVQVSASSLLNGRYSIISEVGQGGFGVVYKAQDTKKKTNLSPSSRLT